MCFVFFVVSCAVTCVRGLVCVVVYVLVGRKQSGARPLPVPFAD
jgi:hypothetical protein